MMNGTNVLDGSASPVSSVPSSSKDLNLAKFINQPTSVVKNQKPDGLYRSGKNISKIGPGVGHGGRR